MNVEDMSDADLRAEIKDSLPREVAVIFLRWIAASLVVAAIGLVAGLIWLN